MNIKKLINEKGWSISTLAAEMPNRDGTKGIKQSSMSRIVNGNPTIDTLKDLAKVLGISLSELVADEPNKEDFIAIIKQGNDLFSASSITEARVVLDKLETSSNMK